MEQRRLKELIQELEEVLAELKVEVYSDKDSYLDRDSRYYGGDDDDGYAD